MKRFLDKKLLLIFTKTEVLPTFEIYDVSAELSEEKDGFFVTYNITEGPQFSIGKIKFNFKSKRNFLMIFVRFKI